MNIYDLQGLRAIRRYQEKHGKPPVQIEATAGYRAAMTQDYFLVAELSQSAGKTTENAPPVPTLATVCIPVMPLGAGDITYKRLVIQAVDVSQELANDAANEKFHRLGAKLARAGLFFLDPLTSQGQQIIPPFLFFSKISLCVFGEEPALNAALANRSNEEQ